MHSLLDLYSCTSRPFHAIFPPELLTFHDLLSYAYPKTWHSRRFLGSATRC
jgi:hypothetical protein